VQIRMARRRPSKDRGLYGSGIGGRHGGLEYRLEGGGLSRLVIPSRDSEIQIDGCVAYRDGCTHTGRSSAAALLRHVYRLLKAHERTTGTSGADFEYILASPLPSPKLSSAEKRLYISWNEDALIDSYFRFHHASYPIVHEPIFRDKVVKWKNNDLKLNSHWQTLYRMVLVTGAFVSCTDHSEPAALVDTEIYKMVNDSFFRLDFFSYGTLEGVQALALMVSIPSPFCTLIDL